MAHNHENCVANGVELCYEGMVFGPCDWAECPNDECEIVGHCECLCHSGRECGCGHTWPRMEKQDV